MDEYAEAVADIVSPVLGLDKETVRQKYLSLSGRPFREQLRLMGVPPDKIEELAVEFERRKIEILNKYYPEKIVWERINKLKKYGIRTAVSTNNECHLVERIPWMNQLFDIVLCYDPIKGLSKGEPHLSRLEELGYIREKTVFVGDSKYDLEVYAPYGVKSVKTVGLWRQDDNVIDTILRLASECNK
ncbi:MAG: HAD hydrolase-like protein [Desulfurococcales archaeon]|nr:HAD hydrolase-like protein [Desulfurococcales archaeon]MEB3788350.1 HAD hydrolase-like protein [Desulfurococcales archaeon]